MKTLIQVIPAPSKNERSRIEFYSQYWRLYLQNLRFPTNTYMIKVNKRNTRKRFEIYYNLIILKKRDDVFVNFEHTSHIFCFYCWLWTLNICWMWGTGNMEKKCSFKKPTFCYYSKLAKNIINPLLKLKKDKQTFPSIAWCN